MFEKRGDGPRLYYLKMGIRFGMDLLKRIYDLLLELWVEDNPKSLQQRQDLMVWASDTQVTTYKLLDGKHFVFHPDQEKDFILVALQGYIMIVQLIKVNLQSITHFLKTRHSSKWVSDLTGHNRALIIELVAEIRQARGGEPVPEPKEADVWARELCDLLVDELQRPFSGDLSEAEISRILEMVETLIKQLQQSLEKIANRTASAAEMMVEGRFQGIDQRVLTTWIG